MLILKYFKIEKKLRVPCPPSSRVVFALKNQSEIKKNVTGERDPDGNRYARDAIDLCKDLAN